MQPLQLILVALVQGLTEYLPISSTAHLILLPRLFGWPDQGLAVDVAANTGTLLAVVAYFRRDLAAYARALLPGAGDGVDPAARRMIPLLALASLPVLVVGIAAGDWISGDARSPAVIAWATIGFGLVLGVADRWGGRQRRLEQVTWRNALVFGLAQATALVPGGLPGRSRHQRRPACSDSTASPRRGSPSCWRCRSASSSPARTVWT